MTGSSPSDLAVAYRSFGRRAESIVAAAADPARREAARRQLEALPPILQKSSARLGVPADAHAIADRIESISPDRWDDAVLQGLRADALEAGAVLRRAEEAARG